jgi:TolB-like protein/DNA-binding winged helix-turn-helix (wHTH) protein/Tfp pilus assembly protein PilF
MLGTPDPMDLQEATPRVVRFGVFELDRRSGELRKDGVRVRLQEQPLRVLDALLAEPGELVTREALRQRLWPDDTFVDFDNGLNRAINRLRAALGDEADNPRFIETLDRRGYRFIAPVGALDAATPAGRPSAPETTSGRAPDHRRTVWRAAGVAAGTLAVLLIALAPALRRNANPSDRVPIRSLAVLPLANLTGDPAQDYFSDGMTDALITNLASLPALRVISRQSIMHYKGSAKSLPEIARELGVEGVVEGSVVRSGGRVRITAQLVDAATDRHLWAHSYERRLEDVLALQGELSRAIAEEVRVTVGTKDGRRLTPERTVKPDAYDAYLLGRHHWNQRTEQSLDRALVYFQAAVAKDPDFALAHAGLALVYAPRLILGYVPPGRGLSEQKTAALRALELDPGLGEARAALAVARMQEWDWEGAEAEFRSAVDTDPNSTVGHLWYSWYLHARGRFEDSLAHRRRALELDPLNTVVNRAVAEDLGATGRDEEALAQWNRTLELEPDRALSHLKLALFHFERGRTDAGSRHLERAHALGPDDPSTLAHLAIVYAVTGNEHQARRLFGQLKAESVRRYVSPVLPAFVHAALGQKDSAFVLLEDAYAARDPLLIPIQVSGIDYYLSNASAAALRSDPRFGDLVQRMGLVPGREHLTRDERHNRTSTGSDPSR